MEMYGNKVFGVEVSAYGLEHGRLDYAALANILEDCIPNNTVRDATLFDWEIVNGDFGDDVVFHDYIISDYGYRILKEYTDELVFYNENLDIYVWGVTHTGTNWRYVLTDIELVDGDK